MAVFSLSLSLLLSIYVWSAKNMSLQRTTDNGEHLSWQATRTFWRKENFANVCLLFFLSFLPSFQTPIYQPASQPKVYFVYSNPVNKSNRKNPYCQTSTSKPCADPANSKRLRKLLRCARARASPSANPKGMQLIARLYVWTRWRKKQREKKKEYRTWEELLHRLDAKEIH